MSQMLSSFSSLVRATSAIQYGGPALLSAISLNIRAKTNPKWFQISTVEAHAESWIIFMSGINRFEHVAGVR